MEVTLLKRAWSRQQACSGIPVLGLGLNKRSVTLILANCSHERRMDLQTNCLSDFETLNLKTYKETSFIVEQKSIATENSSHKCLLQNLADILPELLGGVRLI